MRPKRRRFLVGPALGWVLSRVLPGHAGPVTSATPPATTATTHATLAAYVDTLIPADETPSGTALGVDLKLGRVARQQEAYQRLLDLGLAWLDRQSRAARGRGFAALDQADRDAIVRQAAEAGHDTLPRAFFERTRADAFFHYYGRPESWRGIGQYRGPPQPLGFMDYARAPRNPR